MVEVLAKIEKYINGEEALYPRKGALLLKRRRAGVIRKGNEAPGGRDRSPRRDRENRERSLKRRGNVRDRLGPSQPELQQWYSPNQFTPLTASVSQVLREVQHEKISEMAISDEIRPSKKRQYQIL